MFAGSAPEGLVGPRAAEGRAGSSWCEHLVPSETKTAGCRLGRQCGKLALLQRNSRSKLSTGSQKHLTGRPNLDGSRCQH